MNNKNNKEKFTKDNTLIIDEKENLVKTGFDDLDKIIVGLEKGELITIAGRPGLGKSSLGINIINNVSKQINKNILYFNIESSKDILNKRITSNNVKIIDDISDIEDIKSKCIDLSKQELSLVVIDYLQLIKTSNKFDSKTEEKVYIARTLNTLALALGIPIIVISQLSCSVDEREDKRPTLEDLKASEILLYSDKIICLYSDDYYNDRSLNKVELIIVKNPLKDLGKIELTFNKNNLTFE